MGRVPARRSQVPPEFLPLLLNARPRPPIPEYAQASDILQRWLSAALTGRVSPETALHEAALETRLLLKTK
jgi:multiple sugar transport system substrate-binding protein